MLAAASALEINDGFSLFSNLKGLIPFTHICESFSSKIKADKDILEFISFFFFFKDLKNRENTLFSKAASSIGTNSI